MRKLSFRNVDVDGFNIFYREAGPKDGPVLLLLHGFPSAGHMFRDLIHPRSRLTFDESPLRESRRAVQSVSSHCA